MNNPLLAIVVNHLWQSTLFVAVVWGLTVLLRRNSARLRYSLWLAASLKFLLPFALLAAIGTQIPWHPVTNESGSVVPILDLAGDFSAPLAGEAFPGIAATAATRSSNHINDLVTICALFIWLSGAMLVAVRWLLRWIEIRLALRKSALMVNIDFPAPVCATEKQFEPGVVGIFRPKLLLPAGITERLTAEQMRAVLAHERCHLRCRDNLTASLHMLVETVFWFFPLVWWIGARLIDERERACDEEVIRTGHAPESYAEGILNVCEHYIASRLPCVSGVCGADLRKRIESIVRRTLGVKLDGSRKLVLAATACIVVAAPLAAGMISGKPMQVLFSLRPNSGAYLEYVQMMSAATDLITAATRGTDISRWTCPAPTSKDLVARQETLARTVKTLSPKDHHALFFAVAANSAADMRRMLAGGATWDGDGFWVPGSPMHTAARYGDSTMLQALADAGFSVDDWSGIRGKDDHGATAETPLMIAISAGRLDNADWLIRHGANAGAINQKGGSSPLIRALALCKDKNLVASLLQAGAEPEAKALRIADNKGIDLRTDASKPGPPLQSWRPPSPDAQIAVDLDGDGAADQVTHLLSVDGFWEGLFVKLSRNPDNWIKATEIRSPQPQEELRMEMSIENPRTLATACSKGYGKGKGNICKEGEPSAVTLKNPGIRYSMPESASSVFYWDDVAQELIRVWDSD